MGPNPADWYPYKKRKLGHMERHRGWKLTETVPGRSERGPPASRERDSEGTSPLDTLILDF